MKYILRWIALLMGAPLLSAAAMADNELSSVLEQRVGGDRSGVCVLAARVAEEVAWARVCADPDDGRDLDRGSRFEIGSVSKAMQGIVVAALVEEGVLKLDEPVADLLPEGSSVPRHDDEPIRVRHLLTHSSGLPRLPADMPMPEPHDPYAALDDEILLSLLAETELAGTPGEQFEYSNFGAMLLTLAISHRSGRDFDALLDEYLFTPLGMTDASLGGPVVQGHDVLGNPVSPWHFHVNLAGVGGVRAHLDDMIRFVQANLDAPDNAAGRAIVRSHELLGAPGGQAMAWGWLELAVNDRAIVFHNGGTAGMTTEVALDPEQGVGVIVLADTGLAMHGGLTDLALHLLDPSVELKAPRQRRAESDATLPLAEYEGEYALYDGDDPFMDMVLRIMERDGELYLQAYTPEHQQPAVEMDHAGDERFVREDINLEIRFIRDEDGDVSGLSFSQGPYELDGRRR